MNDTARRLTCVLPCKLVWGRNQGNDIRLGLLLKSFATFWVGPFPDFWIVAPDEDLDRLASVVAPYDGVRLIGEDAYFPGLTRSPASGWFKQQIVKLGFHQFSPAELFLCLDCDMFLCRATSVDDLIVNGKALTSWEAKKARVDWYGSAARLLDCPIRWDTPGLSVTPELLSREICAALERRLAETLRPGPGETAFHALLREIDWTEFTLYSTFAEHTGMLAGKHLTPLEMFGMNPLRGNSVWFKEHVEAWNPVEIARDPKEGRFTVCQSNTLTPADEYVRKLEPLFALARTPSDERSAAAGRLAR